MTRAPLRVNALFLVHLLNTLLPCLYLTHEEPFLLNLLMTLIPVPLATHLVHCLFPDLVTVHWAPALFLNLLTTLFPLKVQTFLVALADLQIVQLFLPDLNLLVSLAPFMIPPQEHLVEVKAPLLTTWQD